jgi:hypothetical protein
MPNRSSLPLAATEATLTPSPAESSSLRPALFRGLLYALLFEGIVCSLLWGSFLGVQHLQRSQELRETMTRGRLLSGTWSRFHPRKPAA